MTRIPFGEVSVRHTGGDGIGTPIRFDVAILPNAQVVEFETFKAAMMEKIIAAFSPSRMAIELKPSRFGICKCDDGGRCPVHS